MLVVLTDETIETGAIAHGMISVTSAKAYSKFVHDLNSQLHRPPFGIITEVEIKKHKDNQHEWVFTPVAPLSEAQVALVRARRASKEVIDTLSRPFEAQAETPKPKGKGGGKVKPGKPAAKKADAAPMKFRR